MLHSLIVLTFSWSRMTPEMCICFTTDWQDSLLLLPNFSFLSLPSQPQVPFRFVPEQFESLEVFLFKATDDKSLSNHFWIHIHNAQWWNVTKYIYLSISILCNLILVLYSISEANIVLFTALHLSDSYSYTSYFSHCDFSYPSCPVKTMHLHKLKGCSFMAWENSPTS